MLQEPIIVIQGDVHSTEDEDSYKLYMFKVHGAPEPEDEGIRASFGHFDIVKISEKNEFWCKCK